MASSSPASRLSRLDLLGSRQDLAQLHRHGRQFSVGVVLLEKVEFFVGEIEGRLHQRTQFDDGIQQRFHARRKRTLQRAKRALRRLRRGRIDQIGNAFGLRQVKLVVQKRALGEFSGTRRARTELKAALEDFT